MTQFQPGHTPWNLGIPRTPQERACIRAATIGKRHPNAPKQLTPEHIVKLTAARRAREAARWRHWTCRDCGAQATTRADTFPEIRPPDPDAYFRALFALDRIRLRKGEGAAAEFERWMLIRTPKPGHFHHFVEDKPGSAAAAPVEDLDSGTTTTPRNEGDDDAN